MSDLNLSVSGMTCASCASSVERAVIHVAGVKSARVNLATEMVSVSGTAVHVESILEAIREAGYEPAFEPPAETSAIASVPSFRSVGAAAVFTAPLVLPMVADAFGLHVMLPFSAEAILAAIVVYFLGGRFYRGAYRALRNGSANMDVLVALGTSAAYGLSLVNGFRSAPRYFETAAVVVTFVLFGKFLEGRARAGAVSALRALERLRPETARRVVAGKGNESVEVVAVATLLVGDEIRIRPGERIPADGIVSEGTSDVDEALVTGESLPVVRAPGDPVLAGSLNGNGPLTVRVTMLASSSFIARIVRSVQSAQVGRTPVIAAVDRVSERFVPIVVALSLLTFTLTFFFGGGGGATSSLTEAILRAVAVLVIACPCALGLAAPTAVLVGTSAAAKRGILFRDPSACDRASEISHVFFDKTGTLSEGRPEVSGFESFGIDRVDLLRLSGSLQSDSEHPIGRALSRAARAASSDLARATEVRSVPGGGMIGRAPDGELFGMGNAAFATASGISEGALAAVQDWIGVDNREMDTVVWAFRPATQKIIGRFWLRDPLKETAADAVQDLRRMHLKVTLLSGDRVETVREVARLLDVADFHAGANPDAKREILERAGRSGEVTVMVGDGVNDAPALAAAPISIAMGTGTDVAMEAASITILRGDPRLVAEAIRIAQAIERKIRQNLIWAFGYNVIAIPAAAFGYLSPALAGGAMALSSVSVILNSRRLAKK